MRAESAPTVKYESLWLPPVPDEASLPKLAADGQFCFVQDRDEVFVFDDGAWKPMSAIRADAPAE